MVVVVVSEVDGMSDWLHAAPDAGLGPTNELYVISSVGRGGGGGSFEGSDNGGGGGSNRSVRLSVRRYKDRVSLSVSRPLVRQPML